jgi:hypothetical protein
MNDLNGAKELIGELVLCKRNTRHSIRGRKIIGQQQKPQKVQIPGA